MTQVLVAIIDDDESVRDSLPDLLREFGFGAKVFASAQDFLSFDDMSSLQCLLLDICMPDMSGPELQRELVRRGVRVPIIFITAQAAVGISETLLRAGAAAVLFKPFSELQLQTALDSVIRRSDTAA